MILRGTSGYIIAARPVGAEGASVFDRIMVLASSNAPRVVPLRPAAKLAGRGAGVTPIPRRMVPTRVPQPAQQPDIQPTPPGFPFAVPLGSSDRPGVVSPVPAPE